LWEWLKKVHTLMPRVLGHWMDQQGWGYWLDLQGGWPISLGLKKCELLYSSMVRLGSVAFLTLQVGRQ